MLACARGAIDRTRVRKSAAATRASLSISNTSFFFFTEENSPGHFGTIDEEEQLVQMAVQRSLIEYGGADHLMQRQYSLVSAPCVSIQVYQDCSGRRV